MENAREKLPTIRNIVYIIAFIILFELVMLTIQIPVKTSFMWFTLSAIAVLCLYLIILCLKLIKELHPKDDNR